MESQGHQGVCKDPETLRQKAWTYVCIQKQKSRLLKGTVAQKSSDPETSGQRRLLSKLQTGMAPDHVTGWEKLVCHPAEAEGRHQGSLGK